MPQSRGSLASPQVSFRSSLRRGALCCLVLSSSAWVGCGGSSSAAHGGGPASARGGPSTASGAPSSNAAGSGAGNVGGVGSANGSAGTTAASSGPYAPALASSVARKVKTLLTGMNVSDGDVQMLESSGDAGLRTLIQTWTSAPEFMPQFRDKMLFFFRNTFQQTGFQPSEDFKLQLLQNGGFDFGPFGTNAVGDDAFARLVQNIEDSFALSAWQLIVENRPFNETLTTQRYMMTTGMKSLYLQIEAPNDRALTRNAPQPIAFKVDYSGNAIPLEQTLDPNSPNYLVFDDQPPVNPSNFRGGSQFPICRGGTVTDSSGATVTTGTFTGQSKLFQRLLGFTPRFPFSGSPTCWEHASKPYFTTQDLSDWQWVTVRAPKSGETPPRAFDLPTLRTTAELPLQLPRIGFFTTPAFLALWNTNDSNQHRVTANQTLLVAFGASFTSANGIVPLSTAGLDAAHAVSSGECYGCHQGLDPLRAFWGNQFDYNDRNDFPTRGFGMTAANPRPTTQGGVLAFLDVNAMGNSMLDLGALLAKANLGSGPSGSNAFASALAQKLCYYANSAPCDASDPEFQRVVQVFQQKNYDFRALVTELFSSPLVTAASATATFPMQDVPVSVARRDHFCAALSNRLGKPDLCALAATLPSLAQLGTARIASSLAADSFSRGSEVPITPSVPTLFHRSATEMLCENIATQVVDGMAQNVYSSANADAALSDMVEKLIGYPASDPKRAQALQIITDHYNAVRMQKGNTATQALRSAFVLACESPTSVAIGL